MAVAVALRSKRMSASDAICGNAAEINLASITELASRFVLILSPRRANSLFGDDISAVFLLLPAPLLPRRGENSVKNDFQVFLDAARRGEEGKQNHSLHVYYLFGRALLSVSLAKINYEKSRAVQGKFMAWEEEQEEELGFVT